MVANSLEACLFLYRDGKYQEYISCLEKYLQDVENVDVDKSIFDALHYLCKAYEANDPKNLTTVIRKYELLIKLSEKFAKEDIDETLNSISAHCEKIIKENTSYSEAKTRALYCIGLICYERQMYVQAKSNFDEYIHSLNHLSSDEKSHVIYTTIKALYHKGATHVELKEFYESINTYESMLKVLDENNYCKGNYRALYNIGMCYFLLRENQESLKYLRESLLYINTPRVQLDKFEHNLINIDKTEVEFNEDDTLRTIAIVYKMLGNFEEAIRLNEKIKDKYHSAIENKDKSSTAIFGENIKEEIINLYYDVRNNLALTFADKNDFKNAMKEISFLDMFEEKDVKDYMLDTKGYILYRNNKNKEALEFFDKAIQKNNNEPIYWFHRGNCLQKLNKFDEAIDSYTTSIEKIPDFENKFIDIYKKGGADTLDTLNNKAVATYKKGDKDGAVHQFKEILGLKYDYIAAHHNLIKLNLSGNAYRSFWDYWNKSWARKIVAGVIISYMVIAISFFLIFPTVFSFTDQFFNAEQDSPQTIEITNASTNGNSFLIVKNVTNGNNNTGNSISSEMLLYGTLSIGILALVLLSPIIRSANIGTTSLELTTVDRSTHRIEELEFREG
jgi:tetratricopeptide (TPR) repeat protein